MIQLAAYNQSNNLKEYLDIDEGENISLNFAVSEIKDFSTRESSRSDTFTLPFTETNNKFFEHIYNINRSTGNFDVYAKTNCEVLVDGITQLQGYLYINDINLTDEYYTVVIIGEKANLADELGEKTLSDLDNDWFATFLHLFSKDNIVNSWDFNMTYVATPADASGIVYPFINYGIDNRLWTLGGADSIQSTSTPIQPLEFKPAFRVKTLLDRIIAEVGYSYDSNFLDNNDFDFDRIYMNLASETDLVQLRVPNYYFRAYNSIDQQITTPQNTVQVITFDSENGDSQSVYNTLLNQFTLYDNGGYILRAHITARWNKGVAETNCFWALSATVNGNNTWNQPASQIYTASFTETRDFYFPIGGNTGDTVQITITAYENATGIALADFDIINGEDTSFFELIQGGPVYGSLNCNPQDNMPKIKQVDFLRSIFQHFNMFVEPKQNKPTELLIEPYPDYMDRGSTVDWTEKLDQNRAVQILPTTDFRKKELNFRWKEGKHYNAEYAQQFRYFPYGSYNLLDKSELSEGEFQNFTEFVEPTNSLINISGTSPITRMCVMQMSGRDKDGSAVPAKQNPTIFYFRKKDLNEPYYIYDEATTLSDQTDSYGYAGHYSDVPVTGSQYDLNFSAQSPIYNKGYWVSIDTQNNVYNTYWKRFMNEVYSDEARILVGYFYLTSTDIHNLKFNNKVFVRDTYYRINKITGYKLNSTEPCKVELIKLFDADVGLLNNCDLEISSFNLDGTITFKDGEGSNATATKDCCLGYGYIWIAGETGGCYWRSGTIPNGDPFEPAPNEEPEGE